MKKLFVAVPSLGTWEADTAHCWAQCLAATSAWGFFKEIKFANARSSDLVSSRTLLAREAIKQESDYIFWFDSDTVFPAHTISTLYSAKLPICSAVGRVKQYDYATCALNNDGTSFDARDASEYHNVDISGFGCILIETRVFKEIGEPWFGGEWSKKDDEWVWRFEDAFFCRKARESGFDIWIDADLSKAIGHKGSCIYWHHGIQFIR